MNSNQPATMASTSLASFSPDDLRSVRSKLLLCYRAVVSALDVLEMPEAEFRAALQDERCHVICDVVKLLAFDRSNARRLVELRRDISANLLGAIVESGNPDFKAMVAAPIDFDRLPLMPAISAAALNSVRP
jgi:hypothetical protein